MDAIEEMKAKAHIRTVEAHKYDPKKILKEKRIGNWVVTVELTGGGIAKVFKIYNADTLVEHHRHFTTVSCVPEDSLDEVKNFYRRWEDSIFKSLCELAQKWN